MVAEFLQHPMYKWSQNFCNIQCVSGNRISATSSGLVVAEFLQHTVHERLQNFCNIQWLTVSRLVGLPLHLFMIVHKLISIVTFSSLILNTKKTIPCVPQTLNVCKQVAFKTTSEFSGVALFNADSCKVWRAVCLTILENTLLLTIENTLCFCVGLEAYVYHVLCDDH